MEIVHNLVGIKDHMRTFPQANHDEAIDASEAIVGRVFDRIFKPRPSNFRDL